MIQQPADQCVRSGFYQSGAVMSSPSFTGQKNRKRACEGGGSMMIRACSHCDHGGGVIPICSRLCRTSQRTLLYGGIADRRVLLPFDLSTMLSALSYVVLAIYNSCKLFRSVNSGFPIPQASIVMISSMWRGDILVYISLDSTGGVAERGAGFR